jgi:integrase
MAIFTGLREGELLALTWAEVDLDAGAIEVRYTLEPTSLKRVEVKTRRGRRRVDIGPAVIAELLAHRERMLAEDTPTAGSSRTLRVTRSVPPTSRAAPGSRS